MRIAIVGAGAVGSGYGALLARGGSDVVLVDPWAEHIAAIERDGLIVETADGERSTVAVTATTHAAGVAGADAVLVLTKAFATADAARELAPYLEAGAVAVTLQNGLGNDLALAAAIGAEQVVSGATTFGAQLLAPGCVRLTPSAAAGRSLTSIGLPPAGTPAREQVQALGRALEAAELPVELCEDVAAVVWRKFAMTASIGPLCALLRCTVADALAHAETRLALEAMWDEILEVATAEGVALDGPELWQHALETWEGIGAHPPSIAVDVQAGRRTEIDALSGAVARLGATHGIATPASALVAVAIRAAQA